MVRLSLGCNYRDNWLTPSIDMLYLQLASATNHTILFENQMTACKFKLVCAECEVTKYVQYICSDFLRFDKEEEITVDWAVDAKIPEGR